MLLEVSISNDKDRRYKIKMLQLSKDMFTGQINFTKQQV